jgi:hypothetical protein
MRKRFSLGLPARLLPRGAVIFVRLLRARWMG